MLIAATASWLTSEPTIELTARSKLISPRPIETGIISFKTRCTYGLRQSNVRPNFSPSAFLRTSGSGISICTSVPSTTPIAYA